MFVNASLDPAPNKQQSLAIVTGAGNCVIFYRAPTDDDLDAHQWRVADALGDAKADRGKARAEIARARREAVIVGWEGVCDAKGPIEFSQQRLLALMLRVPAVESAVYSLIERLYEVESIVGEPPRPLDAGTEAVALTPGGQPNCADSTIEDVELASPSTSE